MTERRRVFIGSAKVSLHVAEATQSILAEENFRVTCWRDAFIPGNYTLDDLIEAANTHDFAIFVCSPDDELVSPGNPTWTPRDNVVFELGLFTAVLGVHRVFVLRAEGSVKVPNDLAGITHATYDPPLDASTVDYDWEGAVRPAVRKFRRAIEHVLLPKEDPYLGLSRVHQSLPDDFAKGIEKATRVRLLNTWIPHLVTLTPALKRALETGCTVEVLLLNPFSPAARARASTLGRRVDQEPRANIAGEIKDSVRQLARLAQNGNFGELLRVYVCPEIPAVQIYQADDYTLFGFFLHDRLAIAGPQLEIAKSGSVMGAVIADELEAVAASSKGPIELHRWLDWLNENL